jgi:hypothetical protein
MSMWHMVCFGLLALRLESGGVGVGVEECVEVKGLQDVWVIHCAEVQVECSGLQKRVSVFLCKLVTGRERRPTSGTLSPEGASWG